MKTSKLQKIIYFYLSEYTYFGIKHTILVVYLTLFKYNKKSLKICLYDYFILGDVLPKRRKTIFFFFPVGDYFRRPFLDYRRTSLTTVLSNAMINCCFWIQNNNTMLSRPSIQSDVPSSKPWLFSFCYKRCNEL